MDIGPVLSLALPAGDEWRLTDLDVRELLSAPDTIADLRWYCPGGHREHPCAKLTRPSERQRRGAFVTTSVHTASISEHFERMGLAMPEPPFSVLIGERHFCLRYDRDEPRPQKRWQHTTFRP